MVESLMDDVADGTSACGSLFDVCNLVELPLPRVIIATDSTAIGRRSHVPNLICSVRRRHVANSDLEKQARSRIKMGLLMGRFRSRQQQRPLGLAVGLASHGSHIIVDHETQGQVAPY